MRSCHLTQEQALDLVKRLDKAGANLAALPEGGIEVLGIKGLQQLVNAAIDQVLGEQWQPIDTVPVNKSVLMLRMGKLGRCVMADGYKQENGVIAWPYVNKEPTHWMPLPKEQS